MNYSNIKYAQRILFIYKYHPNISIKLDKKNIKKKSFNVNAIFEIRTAYLLVHSY